MNAKIDAGSPENSGEADALREKNQKIEQLHAHYQRLREHQKKLAECFVASPDPGLAFAVLNQASEYLRARAAGGDLDSTELLLKTAEAVLADISILVKSVLHAPEAEAVLPGIKALYSNLRQCAAIRSKWPALVHPRASKNKLFYEEVVKLGVGTKINGELPQSRKSVSTDSIQQQLIETCVQQMCALRNVDVMFNTPTFPPLAAYSATAWFSSIWKALESAGCLKPNAFPSLWRLGENQPVSNGKTYDSRIVDGIKTALIKAFERRFGFKVDRDQIKRRSYAKRKTAATKTPKHPLTEKPLTRVEGRMIQKAADVVISRKKHNRDRVRRAEREWTKNHPNESIREIDSDSANE